MLLLTALELEARWSWGSSCFVNYRMPKIEIQKCSDPGLWRLHQSDMRLRLNVSRSSHDCTDWTVRISAYEWSFHGSQWRMQRGLPGVVSDIWLPIVTFLQHEIPCPDVQSHFLQATHFFHFGGPPGALRGCTVHYINSLPPVSEILHPPLSLFYSSNND